MRSMARALPATAAPLAGLLISSLNPVCPRHSWSSWGRPLWLKRLECWPQFHWSVGTGLDHIKPHQQRYVVIATQGQGDLEALKSAFAAAPDYIAFVGSRKKYTALAEKLVAAGIAQSGIDQVQAPAGLDLGAVTPEEIALSILAQLVQERRSALKQNDA